MFKILEKSDEILKYLKRLEESFFVPYSADSVIKDILNRVKRDGDKALIELTKEYDQVDISGKTDLKLREESKETDLAVSDLKVSKIIINAAYKEIYPSFLKSFKRLVKNVRSFHENQKEPKEWKRKFADGSFFGMRNIPLSSVGVYVPGGRAVYASSVMMNVIPAQIAGVKRIVMVSPPKINPHVLVAANELGVLEIYQVGGAQAVAALAYGTATIPKVDKIVGPGNIYVTLAKHKLSPIVGIDSLAGPSDVLIIADRKANPRYIASDLLAQCEHDPNAQAILITDSEEFAKSVNQEVKKQFDRLLRKEIVRKAIESKGCFLVVNNIEDSIDIANRISPEHLELFISKPDKFLTGIKNSGAVFVGEFSPVAIGDYGAGPNHVLPTYTTARFSSPLGVYDFIKKQSVLKYSKRALAKIRDDVVMLAGVEGLDAHKKSVEIRLT